MLKNIFLFCFLILSFYQSYCQNNGSDQIEVYFTQNIASKYQSDITYPYITGGTTLKNRIIKQINEAKSTIDICMYNNSDNSIVSALKIAKTRGVTVRYIADEETDNYALKGNLNFSVLYANPGEGIMHSKFIVADAKTSDANLMIGSSNFTSNGFYDDANNILFIKNKDLTLAFTSEFDEMWDSTGPNPGSNPKSGEDKIDNTPHHFIISGIPIDLYFSPSDNTESHIDEILQSAQFSIRFAMYTFTSDQLASRIVQKKKDGIIVRGITDNNGGSFGKLQYFLQNGIDVLDHTPSSLLHHKYAIIDAEYPESDAVIVTGSHNWTYSANNINDETTLFIHDSELAKLYVAEFNSRFCELAPWDCNLISTLEKEKIDVNVFPTIATDWLHLTFSHFGNNPVTIQIIDEVGRPVLYKRFSSEAENELMQIDIKDLPKGIYFVKLNSGKDQSFTQKFMKL